MSSINPAFPVEGNPTTLSVRNNFAAAASESDANAAAASAAQTTATAAVKRAGDTMTGPLLLARDPQSGPEASTKQYVDGRLAFYNDIGRNKVDNGLFGVWQRGTSGFPAAGGYTADRWLMTIFGDSYAVTAVSLTDADRAAIGDESAIYGLQNVVTGTSAATSFTVLQQRIEYVRRLSGKTVTVSFYAKANSGTPKFGVSFDQAFGSGGSPSAPNLMPGQMVTLTNSFVRYVLTFVLPSSAGVTLGTGNNDHTQLNFWYSAGANFAVRAGNIGVQSPSIVLWGLQVEPGGAATALEKRDPETDYARCSRFYTGGTVSMYAYSVGGGYVTQMISLPVTMRAAPTITPIGVSVVNITTPSIDVQSYGQVRAVGVVTATGACSFLAQFQASADL